MKLESRLTKSPNCSACHTHFSIKPVFMEDRLDLPIPSFEEELSDSQQLEDAILLSVEEALLQASQTVLESLEPEEETRTLIERWQTRMKERLPCASVAGRFSSGKSSLLNKLLDFDVFMEGARETTARFMSIQYGEKVRVVLHCTNEERKEFDLPTESLPWYYCSDKEPISGLQRRLIKPDGFPTNEEILAIDIYWPSEFLKKNRCKLIDTPGVGVWHQKYDDKVTEWLRDNQPEVLYYLVGEANLSNVDSDFLTNTINCIPLEFRQVLGIRSKADILFTQTEIENIREELADLQDGCAYTADQAFVVLFNRFYKDATEEWRKAIHNDYDLELVGLCGKGYGNSHLPLIAVNLLWTTFSDRVEKDIKVSHIRRITNQWKRLLRIYEPHCITARPEEKDKYKQIDEEFASGCERLEEVWESFKQTLSDRFHTLNGGRNGLINLIVEIIEGLNFYKEFIYETIKYLQTYGIFCARDLSDIEADEIRSSTRQIVYKAVNEVIDGSTNFEYHYKNLKNNKLGRLLKEKVSKMQYSPQWIGMACQHWVLKKQTNKEVFQQSYKELLALWHNNKAYFNEVSMQIVKLWELDFKDIPKDLLCIYPFVWYLQKHQDNRHQYFQDASIQWTILTLLFNDEQLLNEWIIEDNQLCGWFALMQSKISDWEELKARFPKLKVTDKITCITPITGQRSTVTVSKIFKSATRPVVLELAGHQVIFKKDDLRNDQAVMVMADLFQAIWNLLLDKPPLLLRYKVFPIDAEYGFVEFVDNASPWDSNPEFEQFLGDPCFLQSLAGSFLLSWILGIRDRHQGNMMLHHETHLFFMIDFGHCVNEGPVIDAARIAIPEKILDALENNNMLAKLFKLMLDGWKALRLWDQIVLNVAKAAFKRTAYATKIETFLIESLKLQLITEQAEQYMLHKFKTEPHALKNWIKNLLHNLKI